VLVCRSDFFHYPICVPLHFVDDHVEQRVFEAEVRVARALVFADVVAVDLESSGLAEFIAGMWIYGQGEIPPFRALHRAS
jgi:hypothetical protein